ncbi:MAG: alcohol dehydrogenase catalytic domain-containing protein [Desulfobacteraceae bacterium]|nr:alcohol dehydrogenase catalytic domain-containing protein [Desulfobacteraceae bacterium]MBC2756230.1 alcohol dehydrogenase catalytic domain-containing protein [Desulfobacteraceae bacterium]
MKAVKLKGPKQLELVDVETPVADGKNVIIEVTACGICGSDLHYWHSGRGMGGVYDLIMGHEFAGIVVDSGNRDDLAEGDRVTALPLDPCGLCAACRAGHINICLKALKRSIPGNNSPGGFSEFLKLRPDMVRKLPDTVNDIQAAMAEPAAVALHAVRTAGICPGDTVMISGGGPIGLLCAAWAKINGAAYIALTEINGFRKDFAANNGAADEIFDAADPDFPSQVIKITGGGFDVAIETSAADAAINLALMMLKPKGRLILAGINAHTQAILTIVAVAREITQKSVMAYLPEEFDTAIDYIAQKRIDVEKLVTSTTDLTGLGAAFERLASGKSEDIKIICR